MSKTYRYFVSEKLDTPQAKKSGGKASKRFKTEKKRKDDRKYYAFTTWIERTAQED
jgi:hypothetical protein